MAGFEPLVAEAAGTLEVVAIDADADTGEPWSRVGVRRKRGRSWRWHRSAPFRTVRSDGGPFPPSSIVPRPGSVDPADPSVSDSGAGDEQADWDPEADPGAVTPDAGRSDARSDAARSDRPAPVSVLSDLPAGTAFGTLVHSVLEEVDFAAADLVDQLDAEVGRQLEWRSMDLTPLGASVPAPEEGRRLLVDGLRAAIETPLGPLCGGARLADIPAGDRLDEMSFDLRLATGGPVADVRRIGDVILSYLDPGDPLRPWALDLAAGAIDVPLAGHLTGSIDLVMRVGARSGPPRFVVADYKTNALHRRGVPARPDDYGRLRLAEAMAEHDYPLQALLYSVALHRYLRWRLPDYRPDTHLGGVVYLFLRGMCGAGGAATGADRPGCLRVGAPGRPGRRAERAARRPLRPGGIVTRTAPWDVPGRRPSRPGGPGPFVDAGVFSAYEVQFAATVSRLQPDLPDAVLLALAVAARAPRFGHVCWRLSDMSGQMAGLDGEVFDALGWPAGRRVGGSPRFLGRSWPTPAGHGRAAPPAGAGRGPAVPPAVLALRTGGRRRPGPVGRRQRRPVRDRRRDAVTAVERRGRRGGARRHVRSRRRRGSRSAAPGRPAGHAPGGVDHRRRARHRQDLHRGPPARRRPPGGGAPR